MRLVLDLGAERIDSEDLIRALNMAAYREISGNLNLLLYWTGQIAAEGPVDESLLEAAIKGDHPMIAQLVSKGVCTKDAVAHTALAHATARVHETIVAFFLESGLNIHDRGNYFVLGCALS